LIMFSLLFLIPDQGPQGLGLPMLGIDLILLFTAARRLLEMRHTSRPWRRGNLIFRFLIPVICFVMILIVAVTVLLGMTSGLYWFVPVTILLIWDASLNAWDLLLRLREPEGKSLSPTPAQRPSHGRLGRSEKVSMETKGEKMETIPTTSSRSLNEVKRIGMGIAFILFPLIFMFAFAVHPGLIPPHRLTELQMIQRMHHNSLLAFGHVLVLFDAAVLIVVTIGLMRLLDHTSAAWAGFIGAVLTVLSVIALGAEKGAECLTMSALDTLTENQFAQMIPGLLAILSHQGWMILVMGVILLAVGLSIQAIGLLVTGAIPRWQSALLFGVWLMGFPDGWELVALIGSILLAIAFIPLGIRIIIGEKPHAEHRHSEPVLSA
jgi:hypothetical protein